MGSENGKAWKNESQVKTASMKEIQNIQYIIDIIYIGKRRQTIESRRSATIARMRLF